MSTGAEETTPEAGNGNGNGNAMYGGAAARRRVREKVRLISQGAYGCVYRPNIQCNGRPGKSRNYVTKLQKQSSSGNETAIGARIAEIPNAAFHFAPVLRSCPIELAQIRPNELVDQCRVANKPARDDDRKDQNGFVLNRIRFVGDETLERYLSRRVGHSYFMLKFFEIHMYLLRSIELLVAANIVHFDLKENNVLYDPRNHAPILIDFGMSVDMSFLTPGRANLSAADAAAYHAAFHIYYEKYPPWCLDIVLCSFLVQRAGDGQKDGPANARTGEWARRPVDVGQLLRVVDLYFSGNKLVEAAAKLNATAVAKSRDRWRQFVRGKLAGKTGKQAVDLIAEAGWRTWDNFSIAAIFLSIWTQYKLAGMVGAPGPYQQLLISVLLATPGTDKGGRQTAAATRAEITGVAQTLTRTSYLATLSR